MLFEPIWFDSLGAKSSCILVKTDISILIDPGVAIMHPSFPASIEKKLYWKMKAKKKIIEASKMADVIIISHYHHDHYMYDIGYENKILFAKNPNEYINDSQRKRAIEFYSKIFNRCGIRIQDVLKNGKKKKYGNPLNDLKEAMNKDFGDYNKRREELINRGIEWFHERIKKWNEYKVIPEIKNNIKIKYAEGNEYKIGKTKIKFTKPLFHGIEFSKIGWVFSTIIEYKGEKLIHTSDVNGPIIEDYANFIIKEKPNIIILDGPPTYMLGYMLNKINLNRAIENVIKIMEESDAIIIYDHHLLRERKYREHTIKVWKYAEKNDKKLFTAAEYIGKKPILK